MLSSSSSRKQLFQTSESCSSVAQNDKTPLQSDAKPLHVELDEAPTSKKRYGWLLGPGLRPHLRWFKPPMLLVFIFIVFGRRLIRRPVRVCQI